MTQQADLKRRIRDRMSKTGERYIVARSHILAALRPPDDDRSSSSLYAFLPGQCRDTATARNFLRAAGGRLSAEGALIDEDLLTGLSGGVGFLYIVFEYPKLPPLLSVLTRYDTSVDQFALTGLHRLGLDMEVTETTSSVKARRLLDQALSNQQPALCVADAVSLSPVQRPGLAPGMAPILATVVQADGDELVLDLGAGRPERCARIGFDAARAAYRKAKARMAVIQSPGTASDMPAAIDDAIRACLDRYTHAPYKGFASNFGFAGMEKWAALLVDSKSPKGWPRLFPEGRAACLGLRRAYEGLQCEMTSPGAGRPAYSRFLRQAARLCDHPAYEVAATAFGKAGDRWLEIAGFIASCGVREVRSGCDLIDAYSEMLDQADSASGGRALADRLEESSEACTLHHEDAVRIYRALHELVRAALDSERAAVGALQAARDARPR